MKISGTKRLSAWLLLAVVMALTASTLRAAKFVQAWEQRYATARGSKVAVDSEGNIIVAGYANRGMSQIDRFLIKYSSNGVGLWTNRWVGSGDFSYTGPGMALGTNGQIYLADFYSSYFGGGYDYLTTAYSNNGAILWTNLYNGPANLEDQAKAVAVARNGDVIVTGCSRGVGISNGFDYVTIKYTGAGSPVYLIVT